MLNLSFDVAASKELANFYLRFSMPFWFTKLLIWFVR
jgi:hypothetical protein